MKFTLVCFLSFSTLFIAEHAAAQCLPLLDSDGDGITNDIDIDDDNDGILDTVELGGHDYSYDQDCDGIADYEDADLSTTNLPTPYGCKDNDGDGRCDGRTAYDEDADKVPNHIDLDSDNDGIPDLVEAIGLNSAPVADANRDGRIDDFVDANGDGLDDRLPSGGLVPANNRTSGPFNAFWADSDGDTIFDVIEAGGNDFGCSSRMQGVNEAGWDQDGNGLLDRIDPNLGGTPLPLPDTDGDGIPDYLDLDSDGDGKPDREEVTQGKYCTEILDSDGDGIPDHLDPDDSAPPVEETPFEEALEDTGVLPSDRGCGGEGCGASATSQVWVLLALLMLWRARIARRKS
jgi:large repetitive protein